MAVTENFNRVVKIQVLWLGKLIGCLSVMLAAVTVTAPQDKTSISGNPNGIRIGERLDKSKPSVFLSYAGEEIVDENCSLKKQPSYLLRLRNNTVHAINVDATYSTTSRVGILTLLDGSKAPSLPDGTRVTLCYEAESILTLTSSSTNGEIRTEIPTQREVPQSPVYCRCVWSQQRTRREDDYPGAWIPSGSSMIFAVPKQYLADGLKIFTIFNYDWEFESGKLRPNEPHHQVFFYSTELRSRSAVRP